MDTASGFQAWVNIRINWRLVKIQIAGPILSIPDFVCLRWGPRIGLSQVPRWHWTCWSADHTLRNADTSPSQVLEFWVYGCFISPCLRSLSLFSFFLYSSGKPSPLLPDSGRASLLPGGLLQILSAQIYTLQYLVLILSQCLELSLVFPYPQSFRANLVMFVLCWKLRRVPPALHEGMWCLWKWSWPRPLVGSSLSGLIMC